MAFDATLVNDSPRYGANIALPGDSVGLQFSDPPERADNVHIKIYENATYEARGDFKEPGTPDRFGWDAKWSWVASFKGMIRNRMLRVTNVSWRTGGDRKKDAVLLTLHAGVWDRADTDRASLALPLLEAEELMSPGWAWKGNYDTPLSVAHRLSMIIEGRLSNQVPEPTVMKHALYIYYPLAMVVPDRGDGRQLRFLVDTSMNFVSGWAKQWGAHWRDHRFVEHTRTFHSKTEVPHARHEHFDDLVRKVAAAAARVATTTGVLALAVGHGEQRPDARGQGDQVWMNLVPEDEKGEVMESDGLRPSHLVVWMPELKAYEQPGRAGVGRPEKPDEFARVRLHALDRLANVMVGPNKRKPLVRRLILYTCRIGANREFIQLMANRLRVPIRAHSRKVAFDTFEHATSNDRPWMRQHDEVCHQHHTHTSSYDLGKRGPRFPHALHHWPTTYLQPTVYPGKPAWPWGR